MSQEWTCLGEAKDNQVESPAASNDAFSYSRVRRRTGLYTARTTHSQHLSPSHMYILSPFSITGDIIIVTFFMTSHIWYSWIIRTLIVGPVNQVKATLDLSTKPNCHPQVVTIKNINEFLKGGSFIQWILGPLSWWEPILLKRTLPGWKFQMSTMRVRSGFNFQYSILNSEITFVIRCYLFVFSFIRYLGVAVFGGLDSITPERSGGLNPL